MRSILSLFALTVALAAPLNAGTKLLRFPDLSGDRVVFSYAGDLWTAADTGGTATRLTSHPGVEVFPRFSPDGAWIAFTGQYDGDEQVYVVPAGGGEPRQLTFYPAAGPLSPRWGYDNQVLGWTPDGSSILFRSMRDGWDSTDTKLYTVAAAGGLPERLPMPESGAGDFSPDGRRLVYSPLVRDFRHWKRYAGGWAQELWVFDLETSETTRVTDDPHADRDPMWIGSKVYFTSDRDGRNNLWVWDSGSGETTQVTRHDTWDVRWPNDDPASGRIVYELDGELVVLDPESGDATSLSIEVPDDGVARRARRVPVTDFISDYAPSPGGQRVAFSARGEIFTAPAEHGRTRNLTRTSGAHDREPAWSPDGRRIAFVSDADGEEELWIVDHDGSDAPRRLTDGHRGRFYDPVWSPDGERIAVRDQAGVLRVVTVDGGEVIEVADDPAPFGLSYTWSPDGRWIAFDLGHPNGLRSVHLWDSETGRVHRVTEERFNSFGATWGPEGDYLWFLSDREYRPQLGSFEFDYVVDRETFIYALALRADVPHPFPIRSDEATEVGGEGEAGSEGENEGEGEGEGEGEAEPTRVEIDLDGLASRVTRAPVEADNFGGLAAVAGHLVFSRGSASYYGRDSDRQTSVELLSLDTREVSVLAEAVTGAALSSDGTRLLVRRGPAFEFVAVEPAPLALPVPTPVSTIGLEMDLVPAEEWRQIFREVWRRYRDFFYVENMHGYDWEALGRQYEPWLEHVGHRSDLNYVISEMIAELSTSHTYVAGGDWELPARPVAGLLGARFELDAVAGRFRIARIFEGDNAEDPYRSPLTEVGVDVAEGDYLLAVNGRPLAAGDNPFRELRHAGGGPVELVVADDAAGSGKRTVRVHPLDSEDGLIYFDWTERNRRRVEEASAGRLGYIHLPNMGADGLREWVKGFYGQVRKEGLVIDVRSNGGGNVSQMIFNRLLRDLLMVDFERHTEYADPYPGVVFTGHLVCLLDEDTASDGDQFAWVFRHAGLGPLVGKRSWGGVVGIYGRGQLIDGGSIRVPEAGSAGPDGQWIIEGFGVEPDIVVENDPASVLAGGDPQLEKGIEILLEKVANEPRGLPEPPPAPVKTPTGRSMQSGT